MDEWQCNKLHRRKASNRVNQLRQIDAPHQTALFILPPYGLFSKKKRL